MMKSVRKVLITGAAGYIGSVLTRLLLEQGYRVWGLDTLLFGDASIREIAKNPNLKFLKADLRDKELVQSALAEVDAVIHLAAIVGDSACSRYPDLTRQTNGAATKMLCDLAEKTTNVKRFVFASTCSNYGKMNGENWVHENSPLQPVSLYAELKVEFEQYLLTRKVRSDFIPTVLRFTTVYGLSPRMRFDLTVNEFSRDVAMDREVKIYGERFWRPYCHVHDIARACILVLESDASKVDHEVFNVGGNSANYTKKDIAELLCTLHPTATFIYVGSEGVDPRDYRVNFDKIKTCLGFSTKKTIRDGISEVYQAVKNGFFPNPYSREYSNV